MNPSREDNQQANNSKITTTVFVSMLVVAILFDTFLALIQLIPVAGSVAASVFNVIPLFVFFIWYKLKGVSFANPKRSISFFGASLIEFIPVINALPTWTAEIIYMYTLDNKEKLLGVATKANKFASKASTYGGALSHLPMAANTSKALNAASYGATYAAQQAEMISNLNMEELKKSRRVAGNEIRPIPRDYSIKNKPSEKDIERTYGGSREKTAFADTERNIIDEPFEMDRAA